jgi:ribosomal protein L37AE/L43A
MKINHLRKLIKRPDHPCPRCKSTHVYHKADGWECADCGRQWKNSNRKRITSEQILKKVEILERKLDMLITLNKDTKK